MEYENKELCRICGGKCCKRCGCDYYVENFDVINKENMIKILDTGNVSIVSAVVFNKIKSGSTITPFLYLRARNKGRDVVDLLSLKHECSMLTDTGCPYDLDHRPRGGVNYIPYPNNECKRCDNEQLEIRKWEPYQNLLFKMVKRYAHMSVDERFRLDVENLFIDVFNENFEGVAAGEIEDVLSSIASLASCFPEEYENARKKCLLTSPLIRKLR